MYSKESHIVLGIKWLKSCFTNACLDSVGKNLTGMDTVVDYTNYSRTNIGRYMFTITLQIMPFRKWESIIMELKTHASLGSRT